MKAWNWSEAEIAMLRRLHGDGATVAQAAMELDRGLEATRSKAKTIGLIFANGRIGRVSVRTVIEKQEYIALPPARYASRTAMMFGDPPLGRSALDQKRAGQ